MNRIPGGGEGLTTSQHGVPDGLHQSPVSCQRLRDQAGEPQRQVGGGIIAMGFGERGEAGEVNEAERRLHVVHIIALVRQEGTLGANRLLRPVSLLARSGALRS